MKRRIINITLGVLIFSIGATIGKLLNWGYFELKKDISIIDALTLFTTIGAAIYITKILEKEVQEDRIEKELHISKISELELLLKIIEDLIEDKDSSFNKINYRIHSCRIIKIGIFASINENFKKNPSAKIAEFENNITVSLNSLKRLLTETPIIVNPYPQLSLVGGLANYSLNRILEINIEINSIRENLFKLKVRINNL
jgi:hypothetical protein